MSDPDPIVAFLTARLDDEAEAASEAVDRDWFSEDNYVESRAGGEIARFEIKADARLAASWGPRRVLADVEAKRAIIGEHRPALWQPECFGCSDSWPCLTLRAFASVYRDRPDFDPSWAS